MHRQAKAAFEASDVVLEEVWVLVEVDGLERKLAESFTTVGIGRGRRCDTSAAELGACAVLRALAVCRNKVLACLPGSPCLLVNSVC